MFARWCDGIVAAIRGVVRGYCWTPVRGHLVERCGSLEPVTEVRILPPQLKNGSNMRFLPAVARVQILATALDASTGATRSLRRRLRGPVAVQLEVTPLGGEQLVVRALLGDVAVLEHHDARRPADRGQAV